MLYRNVETGAVIDVNSELGGAWEPIEEKKAASEEEAAAAPKKKTTRKKVSENA